MSQITPKQSRFKQHMLLSQFLRVARGLRLRVTRHKVSARAVFISGPTGKEFASRSLMWLFISLKPLLTVGQRHPYQMDLSINYCQHGGFATPEQERMQEKAKWLSQLFCNQIPLLLLILFIRKELLGPTDTQDSGNLHKGTNR